MERLYKEITEWQDKTFTKATQLSCAKHLEVEVTELIASIKSELAGELHDEKELELADCFMLLFGICNKAGYDFKQVKALIQKKFVINQIRTWGDVNDEGFVEHVK